jgi:hypothetical protein
VILHKVAPEPRTTFTFALSVYLVNFALPLGFCILNHYWLAVSAGVGAVGLAFLVFWRARNGAGFERALAPQYSVEPDATHKLL